MKRSGSNPVVLWAAFVLVHLWLGLANLFGPGFPLGDVTIVYKRWSDQVFLADFWVGIHDAWVYPILAIFPMLAAEAFGPGLYERTWLSLMFLLNAGAFLAIVGWPRRRPVSRHRRVAAWWWLAFLVLLGPIALGRIDTVTIALGIVGALLAARRPRVAALVLAIAAWVKVWPAALVGAMIVSLKERWRVLGIALGVSLLVVLGALSFGSGANVFSFVSQQTDRGLQVEAPVSTIWLWQAFARVPGTVVYYDQHMLTWQITGDGAGTAITLMTPLMALIVLAVMLLAVLALHRGAEPRMLLATVSLAFVAALIATNKVGSPQFFGWLAVPILLGILTPHPRGWRWFRTPALLTLAIAVLTQAVYPWFYGWLLALHPVMLTVITLRNVAIVVLLGWAVRAISVLPHPATEAAVNRPRPLGSGRVEPT